MSEKIKIDDFFSASNHKLIIRDIFAMYHHRWDVIGETIQNAVDSVLTTAEQPPPNYKPCINITYNAKTLEIMAEDNGIGIPSEQVKRVAAPHFSLKEPSEATRGEFGVGLTFVAFSSNDFRLESVSGHEKSVLQIKNGYSWVMSENDTESIDITFSHESITQDTKPYTKVSFKPVRFPEYTLSQLCYVLQRHTAVGDFWASFKNEEGLIKTRLIYTGEDGKVAEKDIPNKFLHPADFLKKINVETVDLATVKKEVEEKGKEAAMPNWIGFGLTDKDTIVEESKEFAYYALLCRTFYYKNLSEEIGIASPSLGEENESTSDTQFETELSSGIFACKKGMPLGAIVEPPKRVLAGFWRMMFILINCDSMRTEPGRKKLHVDDELLIRRVAGKVYDKLIKYHHYFIPRDPDEEIESLLRNVQKAIDDTKNHRQNYPLTNPANKITMSVEPANEQMLIALFHELIGAGILKGYKAHRLSAAETYDGIYEYKIEKSHIGSEHWNEWLQSFPAKERKEKEDSGYYHVDLIIVEFKMHLEKIITDFLQKTKYHPHIKLIVAWDANKDSIKRRGWLLEDLPQPKQKFYGAKWRLRPSAEGQTRGILATDVLLLKDFLRASGE